MIEGMALVRMSEAELARDLHETEFLLSSITVMELEHGWHRANTPEASLEG